MVLGKSGTVLLSLSHPEGWSCLVPMHRGFLRVLSEYGAIFVSSGIKYLVITAKLVKLTYSGNNVILKL